MIGYILAGIGICAGITGAIVYDIYSDIKLNKSLLENERAVQENKEARGKLLEALSREDVQERLRSLRVNINRDLEEKLDKLVE